MTAMPQMVALLNGFGGLASVLVAGAALIEATGITDRAVTVQLTIATAVSGLIGAVTLLGQPGGVRQAPGADLGQPRSCCRAGT